jgi:alcohol dehydrogenase class IV
VDRASAERIDSLSDAVEEEWRQDIALKRAYAKAALWGMAVQVGIADLAFAIYAFARGWDIPDGVMTAWLAATVVQVVAVTLAVTRGLFPPQRR